jgi:hypothetical protein
MSDWIDDPHQEQTGYEDPSLTEVHNADGSTTVYYDADQDGVPNSIGYDRDSDGDFERVEDDTDGDGRPDTTYFDFDNDGAIDAIVPDHGPADLGSQHGEGSEGRFHDFGGDQPDVNPYLRA